MEEDIVVENTTGAARDRIIMQRTNEQMRNRVLTMGFHHGQLTPLPSSWVYPTGLTVINLMTLWLLGNRREKVPPLRLLSPKYVLHFDKRLEHYQK